MKFHIFNEDKLVLLGMDIVGVLIHRIMKLGILEEYCTIIARIDSHEIQCEEEFDEKEDFDYILFHLVTFGTTLFKYNATSYVVRKKFFGGYSQDDAKVLSFVKGLEAGLKNFQQKGKFVNIKEIKAEAHSTRISYSCGNTLSRSSIPYFYFEQGNQHLEEISNDFAKNIAYIRKPRNPEILITILNEKAKEIVPLAHSILCGLFVE